MKEFDDLEYIKKFDYKNFYIQKSKDFFKPLIKILSIIIK